jgi:hypothetical protein
VSHIWSESVKVKSSIVPLAPTLKIAVVSSFLLLNTFAVSSSNFFDLFTAEMNSHNTAFATLDGETSPSSSNASANTDTGPGSIEYNARYFCGTILGQDGPLRPGRYDSEINIFNRQPYPISFLWNAVPSSTPQLSNESEASSNDSDIFADNTSHKLQTLPPGSSVSISCKDLVPTSTFLLYSNVTDGVERFVEGVSTISFELDPSIQAAISSSSTGTAITRPSSEGTTEPSTNVLSVDVIYTVNAIEVPSREIVLQLIEYTIDRQDPNGRLPAEIISKPLSATVPIRTNETVNPDSQVRDVLAKEYSLNGTERQSLDITIRNLSLGVGALDDNHAISLQRINGYQSVLPGSDSSDKNNTSLAP